MTTTTNPRDLDLAELKRLATMTEPNEAEKAMALRLARAWHCPEAPETVSDDKSWVLAAYLEGVLAGYREELTQPAHVLAEAERLMREACHRSGYVEVCLHGNKVSVSERYDGLNEVVCDTLAEVYAKLAEERDE